MKADEWVECLQMEAHPEGGYYKASFQSDVLMDSLAHGGERVLYTSIYFLLQSEDVSHLHRLKSDELWYFHAGSSLTVHILEKDGTYRQEKLGLNFQTGEKPQIRVGKGSVFGSTVDNADSFALVGCMVAPGFDFADFELFTQSELAADYPQHEAAIKRLAYKELPPKRAIP